MVYREIDLSDRATAQRLFFVSGIFQAAAVSYALQDDPLPVIHETIADAQSKIDAGEDVMNVAMDVLLDSTYWQERVELSETMKKMHLDAEFVERAVRLEERVVGGPQSEDAESADELLLLRTVNVLAEACATKFGEATTASLMPAAMKTADIVDFYDRYYLFSLKKLSASVAP